MRPLEGCLVLDFSTLLPGPLATLLLAEAGADVVSIARPGSEEMPALASLQRGKRRMEVDLKDANALEQLQPLLKNADVMVEQFRPGVMQRLRLGYDDVTAINPDVIYCSITGYGQIGPKSGVAGHDVNYIAETGLLAQSMGSSTDPVIPPALLADIAGGSYPAVINILLALRRRDATGRGCRLDVSMTDNLFTLMLGGSVITSRSPRYRLYPTRDRRILAVGALEQRFWDVVCDITGLETELRDDSRDPARTGTRLAELIAAETADTWARRIAGRDCCCSVVATAEEAMADAHFRARGVRADGHVPIDPQFRHAL